MGFYMFLPCCTAMEADESEPKLPRWKLKASWVRNLWTLLDQSLFKHNVQTPKRRLRKMYLV